MYSCWPLYKDEQKQDDQLEPTYSSSVSIRDVVLNTSQKQWTIGMGGEKGSEIPMLITRHDGDDIWRTTLNVKVPNEDFRFRNEYFNPVRVNEENSRFVSTFGERWKCWKSISVRNSKLTEETFCDLHHTTWEYFSEELKMTSILPGKFQTDYLEERLGQ